MYFTKKYWKIIIYIYKLNRLNKNLLINLAKENQSYIPFIFREIKYIYVYTGKVSSKYILNNTNFRLGLLN